MAKVVRLLAVTLATLGLGMTACAREVRFNSGPSWVGDVGPDAASGVVRRVGNEPFVRTVLEDESGQGSVVVAGVYEIEIGRLAGARVSATGRFARSEELGRYLDVSSYEIVAVDEERPHLGTLEQGEDGFLLRSPGGEAIPLGTLSEKLAAALGGRVWVILDDSGNVIRYGILRTPEEMAELTGPGSAG